MPNVAFVCAMYSAFPRCQLLHASIIAPQKHGPMRHIQIADVRSHRHWPIAHVILDVEYDADYNDVVSAGSLP